MNRTVKRVTWSVAILAVVAYGATVGCAHPPSSDEARSGIRQTTAIDLGEGVTIQFVPLPAGRFLRGSPEGEYGRYAEEGPQREIEISEPFWLGTCEVTRGQFRRFVKDTGYRTDAEKAGWSGGWTGTEFGRVEGLSWKNPGFEQNDSHPVVCVSWNDAAAFCKWLGRKTGRTVRLPREAEWEYACRAGSRTAYQWGDLPKGGKGWCNGADRRFEATFGQCPVFEWDDRFATTAPVGSFKPNAFGLYDMHGNVWEWCADWYGEDYYATGTKADPAGPPKGTVRVMRGGSWAAFYWYNRSACRYHMFPDCAPESSLADTGFRVLMPANRDPPRGKGMGPRAILTSPEKARDSFLAG